MYKNIKAVIICFSLLLITLSNINFSWTMFYKLLYNMSKYCCLHETDDDVKHISYSDENEKKLLSQKFH